MAYSLEFLPPGYKFAPTDTEIIVDYLTKKVSQQPLPMNLPEIDIYQFHPRILCHNRRDDDWYFFTKRRYERGQKPNRSVANLGFWKPYAKDIEVKVGADVVGFKLRLEFYEGPRGNARKTIWKMCEYRILKTPYPQMSEECVLCKVYINNHKSKDNQGVKEADDNFLAVEKTDGHPDTEGTQLDPDEQQPRKRATMERKN